MLKEVDAAETVVTLVIGPVGDVREVIFTRVCESRLLNVQDNLTDAPAAALPDTTADPFVGAADFFEVNVIEPTSAYGLQPNWLAMATLNL